MGISESHRQFTFKIEPKPGGGYVSKSDNAALVCEGDTEEEVRDKALQKLGELAGPEVAAAINNLQHTSSGEIAGEKKFSISINKKTTFSITKNQPASDNAFTSPQLGTSLPDPLRQTSGGLSSTVKLLIGIGILIFVLLLVYRR